jgi:hypothetical protein
MDKMMINFVSIILELQWQLTIGSTIVSITNSLMDHSYIKIELVDQFKAL